MPLNKNMQMFSSENSILKINTDLNEHTPDFTGDVHGSYRKMIPAEYKNKIPKEFSFPSGAKQISKSLAGGGASIP